MCRGIAVCVASVFLTAGYDVYINCKHICIVAEKEEFYVLRKSRDDEANRLYLKMLEEESDGLYIQDIIRGGIKNDDPRIPRNISK